ncbi:hypothetical protein LSAT2_008349 [Lamellibrachia satsuma]|nr:hypothetical protein LSAT2_008349 [Lamellibrachia satsuma]
MMRYAMLPCLLLLVLSPIVHAAAVGRQGDKTTFEPEMHLDGKSHVVPNRKSVPPKPSSGLDMEMETIREPVPRTYGGRSTQKHVPNRKSVPPKPPSGPEMEMETIREPVPRTYGGRSTQKHVPNRKSVPPKPPSGPDMEMETIREPVPRTYGGRSTQKHVPNRKSVPPKPPSGPDMEMETIREPVPRTYGGRSTQKHVPNRKSDPPKPPPGPEMEMETIREPVPRTYGGGRPQQHRVLGIKRWLNHRPKNSPPLAKVRRGKVSGEGREQNIAMRAMRLGMLLGMRECLPYIPRGMATDKGSKVGRRK